LLLLRRKRCRIMTTLSGTLERITFHNEKNRFMIARLRSDDAGNLVTILGVLPGVNPGENLKLTGKWETHPRYGQQFKVTGFEVALPATLDGIKKYLKSGMIKGIGGKTADRLIRHFSLDTIDVIDRTPEKLTEVEGIGKKTAARIVAAWREHHDVRELMDFLAQCGANVVHSAKMLQFYGNDALSIVKETPYRILSDIPEIDFHTADLIAKELGYEEDSSQRVEAGIEFLLGQSNTNGHTYMRESDLMETFARRFKMNAEPARDALDEMAEYGRLVLEPDYDHTGERRIYTPSLYEAETGLARRLNALLTIPVRTPDVDHNQIIDELVKKIAIRPSLEQLGILEGILSHRVAVITGGPGTGKTTLVRAITVIYNALGKKVLLAAPTGRAARRLFEVTGRKAETIHRMLRYNLSTGLFDRDNDDPLEGDVVIVDEASMVDTVLMSHLLNAVSMSARLILVGDVFQLPPIGPGNVLSDLIECGKIRAFELTEIFRQAHESPIVSAAHGIRRGELPDIHPRELTNPESDFLFIEQGRPEAVLDIIVSYMTRILPAHLDARQMQDVQVITPMHKGTVGTLNLNQVLQNILNPKPAGGPGRKMRFRVHDKVMHLKNNYQKEVFNGDIGVVCAIEEETRGLSVKYDDRIVDYTADEQEDLTLAYAISVHKSQGSEYSAVIIPLLTQHFMLLQRNLLYTAVTRGKHVTIVVGTKKALTIALNNDRPNQRLTTLAEKIENPLDHT
jgi:exodeoxyribonuclease V alpha subunit